jgi:hypothetical protein
MSCRKKIIGLCIGTIFVIIIIVSMAIRSSSKKYDVSIKSSNESFARTKIYSSVSPKDSDNKSQQGVLAEVTKPEIVQLKKGTYVIVVSDKGFNETRSYFEVDKAPTEVAIDFSFTQQRVDSILARSKADIKTAVIQSIKGFNTASDTVDGIELYKNGVWGSAYIVKAGYPADYYHVVFRKKDNNWKIMTKPAIVLTASLYPDIPRNIVDSANKKTSTNDTLDNPALNPSAEEEFTGDGAPPEEFGR